MQRARHKNCGCSLTGRCKFKECTSADESVCVGPAQSNLSYLNIPSIISAAEVTGADAIHPTWIFIRKL